jgi:hypothetical protein
VTNLSLKVADEVYDTASICLFTAVTVNSEAVAAVREASEMLFHQLRNDLADENLRSGYARLKSQAFLIRATPLSSTDPVLGVLGTITNLEHHFEACEHVYPEHAPAIRNMIEALSCFFHSRTDELARAIVGALLDGSGVRRGRSAILLPAERYRDAVQAHLRQISGNPSLDVLSLRELAARRPYKRLVVVGSPWWYRGEREWIFTAPRTCEIVLVGFSTDPLGPLPAAQAFSGSEYPPLVVVDERAQDLGPPAPDFDFRVDPAAMAEKLANEDSASVGSAIAEARLFVLAGGYGVFLPVREQSHMQVLNAHARAGSRIESRRNDDLEPGDYILLRSEGSGDLVSAVADSLLGDAAAPLRLLQSEWKELLRTKVSEWSAPAVVTALHNAGSTRANTSNLANWCSAENLRTWDFEDFEAIMKVVGWAERANEVWKAMGSLDAAHHRAGKEIREMLEEAAEKTDISDLEHMGQFHFTLPIGGGALTAFRVDETPSETVRIREQLLSRPFRTEV